MANKLIKDHPRRIFLLPNLLTTASLFAAFYAIVAATQSKFEIAAIAILVAIVADALDGRVARLTDTQSAFGAQYDSLADMVSAGVAPALLIYNWSLSGLGKLGWLAAFIYAATVAMRLARFNARASVVDAHYFQGLPCPGGAGVIASMVWFCQDQEISGMVMSVFAVVIAILIGVLMVSNVRYYSFKDLDFKKSLPSIVCLFVIMLFVGISLDPPLVLLLAFSLYAVSGPIYMLVLFFRKKDKQLVK